MTKTNSLSNFLTLQKLASTEISRSIDYSVTFSYSVGSSCGYSLAGYAPVVPFYLPISRGMVAPWPHFFLMHLKSHWFSVCSSFFLIVRWKLVTWFFTCKLEVDPLSRSLRFLTQFSSVVVMSLLRHHGALHSTLMHYSSSFTKTPCPWWWCQPSLSSWSPSLFFNPQHRGLSNSPTLQTRWPKVMEFRLQHQSLPIATQGRSLL